MNFINGAGVISPQQTVGVREFPVEIIGCCCDYLQAIEPVYRNYIDPVQSRRMSRLIKMGIAAARLCVLDSGIDLPDGIITGTGLGSVEDTEKILAEITHDERFLNPTPFIQSTYNTISSQVAIQLKCHGYNSTYVHRIFSFESGLMDAMLQLSELPGRNFLVGAIDEMTLNHLQITRRIGLWRKEPVHNLELWKNNTDGALAGEGAAFFMISDTPSPSTYGQIVDVSTIFSPEPGTNMSERVEHFLLKNGISTKDIDLVLLGMNGDARYDDHYNHLADCCLPDASRGWFKHLCGEYHTASGFGLFIAATILRNQIIPEIIRLPGKEVHDINYILIYNQFRGVNHTLILLKRFNQELQNTNNNVQ
jgi:3-oxoacyl-(acyl-carrier-protein) synthase